jgi:hypothetical protein
MDMIAGAGVMLLALGAARLLGSLRLRRDDVLEDALTADGVLTEESA